MSLSRIVVVLEMGGWSSEVKLRMQFKSLVLKIFIVWDGCQNFQNKFKLWRHLPEWISVVWDGCQKCQNEYKLWGHLPEWISVVWDGCHVARSVRMNLNFGDGCQNAFLLLGTVARMHFYCLGRLPEVSEKSKLWGRLPECISIGWDGCQICHFYHWDRCQNQIWQKLIGLPSILAKAIAPSYWWTRKVVKSCSGWI